VVLTHPVSRKKTIIMDVDMGENKPFDFWNDHSLEFLDMAMKRDFQECSGQS